MANISDDPRIDPRIKVTLGAMPTMSITNVATRQQLLDELNTPEAIAQYEQLNAMLEMMDSEDIAPSTGLTITTHEFTSAPDDNTIKVQFIRPESTEPLPCVYYIHGGGMQHMSCFSGIYRAWGKIIAQQRVAALLARSAPGH